MVFGDWCAVFLRETLLFGAPHGFLVKVYLARSPFAYGSLSRRLHQIGSKHLHGSSFEADLDDADEGDGGRCFQHRSDGKRDDRLFVVEHANHAVEESVGEAHRVCDGTVRIVQTQGDWNPHPSVRVTNFDCDRMAHERQVGASEFEPHLIRQSHLDGDRIANIVASEKC